MFARFRDVWFFLFLFLVFARPAFSEGYITFPSDIDWVTRRSNHFEAVYRRGETKFAERALAAAEKAHQLISPLFPQHPERTYLVLADFKDGLNGYAIDFPYPHMVIFASPPEGSSTLASLDEWLESVILHEYVHVLHLYPASGLWKVGRALFGSWVLPNGLMPSHLHEGLAVFLETEFGKGGRGQSADFQMYRRMAVHEGKWGNEFVPIDLLEGSVMDWPHGHSPYFFGYWAWKEVWARKQGKGVYQIVERQSGNWPYWTSRPFQKELGINYPTLWEEIYTKGRDEASAEIAQMKKAGVASEQFLTDSRFNKWDLTLSSDGTKAALRSSQPEMGTRIELLSLPSAKPIEAFEPSSGSEQGLCLGTLNGRERLLYVDSKWDSNYQIFIVKQRDLVSHSNSSLQIEAASGTSDLEHVHALSCSPDLQQIAVYVEQAGKGRVLTYRAALKDLKGDDFPTYRRTGEWALPEKTWISSVLVGAPTLGILRDRSGSSLYAFAGEGALKKIGPLSARPFYSLTSGPGGKLFAIGAEDGSNELWEISRSDAKITKKVSVLGGLDSVAFNGTAQLYGLSYRHGGYDLAVLNAEAPPSSKRKIPVVIERRPAEKEVNAADLQFESEEEYSPWGSLWPRAWIPNLLIVPDGMQISAWIPGFDIAQKNTYTLYGGYDTRGSPFISGSFAHRFWKQSNFMTEAYFSPSYLISARAFLKTWGGSVGVSTQVPHVENLRFGWNVQFRRVEASKLGPEKQSVGFGVNSSYAFGFKSRPRAIAPHRGTRLSASYSLFFKGLGSSDEYDSLLLSADQYVSSPWLGSHIFYLGARFGYTAGTVVYNSFFQGGGELIFSQGKGTFLNRGFLAGSFLGRRMFSLNAEYRFPIWDVYRGHGLWPFFLQRIHTALIADVLTFDYGTRTTTVPHDIFQKYYGSVGVELKSDWKLFYYLPALIRVGFYRGIGQSTLFGIEGEPLYVTFALEGGLF